MLLTLILLTYHRALESCHNCASSGTSYHSLPVTALGCSSENSLTTSDITVDGSALSSSTLSISNSLYLLTRSVIPTFSNRCYRSGHTRGFSQNVPRDLLVDFARVETRERFSLPVCRQCHVRKTSVRKADGVEQACATKRAPHVPD